MHKKLNNTLFSMVVTFLSGELVGKYKTDPSAFTSGFKVVSIFYVNDINEVYGATATMNLLP